MLLNKGGRASFEAQQTHMDILGIHQAEPGAASYQCASFGLRLTTRTWRAKVIDYGSTGERHRAAGGKS